MITLRYGLVGCFFGLFMCGTAMAEAVLSTSSPNLTPAQAASIDRTITALIAVERTGIDGLSKLQLVRLGTTPQADPQTQIGYSRASLARMPNASGGPQWSCLAEALYFEARGESVLGQFAVAEVILNRVESARYPDSICGVIRQGTGRKHACQFSFYCDGRAEVITEQKAYDRVAKVARIVMDGKSPRVTKGATHYHTKAVSPNWSRVFPRTATIGAHHFYREPLRLSRN